MPNKKAVAIKRNARPASDPVVDEPVERVARILTTPTAPKRFKRPEPIGLGDGTVLNPP